MADDSTLVSLARTLELIMTVQDLASTNKTLRANFREREVTILGLVRDLVSVSIGSYFNFWERICLCHLDADSISTPQSKCREVTLNIVQNLPASLIDHETLQKVSPH
jgi:E3 ubiquitin-protein ligase listerin